MNPQIRTRVLSAAVGALGVVGLGMTGLSLDTQTPAPVTVVAPVTGAMVQDAPDDVTTTTSSPPSFRPSVTATVPAPPTD